MDTKFRMCQDGKIHFLSMVSWYVILLFISYISINCYPLTAALWVVIWQRIYKFERKVDVHVDTDRTLSKIGKVFESDDIEDEFDAEDNTDADLVIPKGVCRSVNVRKHRKVYYAARVALLAKAQVGLMSNTRASQLVYQRICRDEMNKHGLRPVDIARMLPIATAACFIKTDEDFLAESLLKHEDVVKGVPQGGGFKGK
jgi:hypothetical protein